MSQIRSTFLRYRPGAVFTLVSLLLVGAIQFLRFYQIDQAPPGFYVDESTGATQVMCIKQTGSDYFQNRLPLFSPSLGGGFYTPPYLYGQVAWTTAFGDSITSFRSFVAWVTLLTLLVFAAFIRRWVGLATALWFLILASISPWAWQFSRIAWDPPLAPLFLGLGIWAMTAGRKWSPYLGGIFFAAAAYAYPPTRVQAGVLLLLMPGVKWRDTFKALFAFGVTMVPLLIRSMDEDFRMRSNLVGIWSDYSGNPYRGESLSGLALGVLKNTVLHLTPDFLLLKGDANLRHSTQRYGMLSYPQVFALAAGAVGLLRGSVRSALTPAEWSLLWIGGIGAITGILPAALTWESVPHALRSIAAWPFFCILGAMAFAKMSARWRVVKWLVLAASIAFAYFYLDDYFNAYPERSRHLFQTDNNPFALSYQRMSQQGLSCDQVRSLLLP